MKIVPFLKDYVHTKTKIFLDLLKILFTIEKFYDIVKGNPKAFRSHPLKFFCFSKMYVQNRSANRNRQVPPMYPVFYHARPIK